MLGCVLRNLIKTNFILNNKHYCYKLNSKLNIPQEFIKLKSVAGLCRL